MRIKTHHTDTKSKDLTIKLVLQHYSFDFTIKYSLAHGIIFTAATSTTVFCMHTVRVQLNQLSISFGLNKSVNIVVSHIIPHAFGFHFQGIAMLCLFPVYYGMSSFISESRFSQEFQKTNAWDEIHFKKERNRRMQTNKD